jgi:hypothetical protein
MTACLALLAPLSATAAGPHDLDASFGTQGRRLYEYGTTDARFDVLVQLAATPAGYLSLVERTDEQGILWIVQLDRNGVETAAAPLGLGRYIVQASTFTPDGKLVTAVVRVADNGDHQVEVTRWLANATRDSAFGVAGSVIIGEPGANLHATALAADALGRVLVGGDYLLDTAGPNVTLGRTFVAKLTPNGQPVASFDGDGLAVHDLLANQSERPDALVQSAVTGAVYLCHRGIFVGQSDALLTRVLANGTVDAGYGSSGTVYIDTTLPSDVDRDDVCRGVVLRPSSEAAYLAVLTLPTDGKPALPRLVPVNADGLDGTHGIGIPSAQISSLALAMDRGGRLLMLAASGKNGDLTLDAYRFTSSGAPDAKFNAGAVRYPVTLPPTPNLADTLTTFAHVAVDARGRALAGVGLANPTDALAGWTALQLSGDVVFADSFDR